VGFIQAMCNSILLHQTPLPAGNLA